MNGTKFDEGEECNPKCDNCCHQNFDLFFNQKEEVNFLEESAVSEVRNLLNELNLKESKVSPKAKEVEESK
jgi:hypothetical protein